MNRVTNNYGAVDHKSPVGQDVDKLDRCISSAIRDMVTRHKLTPDEINTLQAKAVLTVTAICSESLLLTAIAMRRDEKAKTVDVTPLLPPAYQKPQVWCDMIGVEVVDPDGWNRMDFDNDWNKPITIDVFAQKYSISTTRIVDREKFKTWRHLLR